MTLGVPREKRETAQLQGHREPPGRLPLCLAPVLKTSQQSGVGRGPAFG